MFFQATLKSYELRMRFFRSLKSDELSKNLDVEDKKGVVRVTDYQQTMVISDNGENSSKGEKVFLMTCFKHCQVFVLCMLCIYK